MDFKDKTSTDDTCKGCHFWSYNFLGLYQPGYNIWAFDCNDFYNDGKLRVEKQIRCGQFTLAYKCNTHVWVLSWLFEIQNVYVYVKWTFRNLLINP